MDELSANIPTLIFMLVGTVAVAASILVVAMRNPVHSALFLLLTFLCVAVLFILEGAEFVGAVQVLVYAGGIMVLFLFVVMLINVHDLPEHKMLSPYWKGGLGVGLVIFLLLATVVRPGVFHDPVDSPKALRTTTVPGHRKVTRADGTTYRKKVMRKKVVGNSEAIGDALYRDYLVPFELASLFLLVGMVGAIVIGKRELSAEDEDLNPAFIRDRAAEEKSMKADMHA
jgi:NADH-quinone oxidoreductase subunit J